MNTREQKLYKCLRTLYPTDTIDITKNKHGNPYILIVSRKFQPLAEGKVEFQYVVGNICNYLEDHGFQLEYLREIVWRLRSPEELKNDLGK